MDQLKNTQIAQIMEKSFIPFCFLLLAFLAYNLYEIFVTNSRSRKIAIYKNASEKAKQKVAEIKRKDSLKNSKLI